MQLPSYFLPRPTMRLDDDTITEFETLLAEVLSNSTGASIDYTLSAPKWQFLCYLCDTKGILLHGSSNPDIEEFEPRLPLDSGEFSGQCAVYAASDGIWPIYFAIADRDRYVTFLLNTCFRVVDQTGQKSEPYYFLSVNSDALPHNPWRDGTIYLLPSATFKQPPMDTLQELDVELQEWASLVPVKPLAKLAVCPADFPFLIRVYPHDAKTLGERARLDPGGFPWADEVIENQA